MEISDILLGLGKLLQGAGVLLAAYVGLLTLQLNTKSKEHQKTTTTILHRIELLSCLVLLIFSISYISFFFIDRSAFLLITKYNLYRIHTPFFIIVFILSIVFLFKQLR